MVDAERAAFEAFATSKVRRDEGERFMARDRKGEYVSPAARAAWASWQARGLWEAENIKAEGERLMWRTSGQPATLLRAIQNDAARGIEICETLPGVKDPETRSYAVDALFTGIHQRVCLAMQLKRAPGAESPGAPVFEINRATGRVNVTPSEAMEAERRCAAQARALVHLIQVDEARAINPADIALAHRVKAAAMGDYAEFENLLTFPEVNRLFTRGALHFRQPAPAPAPAKAPRKGKR